MIECVIKCKFPSEVALFRLDVSIFPHPQEKAHLRITNTLQELDLLVQFVTLFDKSRFSKEPSYPVSSPSLYTM